MLTAEEIQILEDAKEANCHWFSALLSAASIMTQRRQKYAGRYHPYFNFVDMCYRLGATISQVFKFYLNIKASRLSTTEQDYTDERVVDTWIDVANYALIAAGWSIDHLSEEDVVDHQQWEQNQYQLTPDMVEHMVKSIAEIGTPYNGDYSQWSPNGKDTY